MSGRPRTWPEARCHSDAQLRWRHRGLVLQEQILIVKVVTEDRSRECRSNRFDIKLANIFGVFMSESEKQSGAQKYLAAMPDAIFARWITSLPPSFRQPAARLLVVLSWLLLIQGTLGLIVDTRLFEVFTSGLMAFLEHTPRFLRGIAIVVSDAFQAWMSAWRNLTAPLLAKNIPVNWC